MRVLIAEDDPVSRLMLEATLEEWEHEVVVTSDGMRALSALQEKHAPPLAILDWMMPGMDGPEICRQLRLTPTSTPVYILLLTAKNSKEEIVAGLHAGANDYLTKPFDREELKVRVQVGARIVELQRSLAERVQELEEAIVERKRAEEALRNLTLTDDLTGLYNRRGFFTMAEHHFKTARRRRQSALLIYADMDGLKHINDTWGHDEGSLAITMLAEVLRQTFRDSDVVARLGGDEFAILATDVSAAKLDDITARLWENLRLHNEQGTHQYKLALSIGAVRVDPGDTSTVEELTTRADQEMYKHKRGKRETTAKIASGL